MTEDQIYQIIIGAIVALVSGSGTWAVFKRKLSQFVALANDVNDAVKDDSVSEAEFQKIWADFMAFVKPNKTIKAGP